MDPRLLNTPDDRRFWKKMERELAKCIRKWPNVSAGRTDHGSWEMHGPPRGILKFGELAIVCSEHMGAVGPDEFKIQYFLDHMDAVVNPNTCPALPDITRERSMDFEVESISSNPYLK